MAKLFTIFTKLGNKRDKKLSNLDWRRKQISAHARISFEVLRIPVGLFVIRVIRAKVELFRKVKMFRYSRYKVEMEDTTNDGYLQQ